MSETTGRGAVPQTVEARLGVIRCWHSDVPCLRTEGTLQHIFPHLENHHILSALMASSM